MENNEIMEVMETEAMNEEIVVRDGSGIGTGLAVAIGAGLACAVAAGVKLAKWGIAKFKAKKELHVPDHEVVVEEEDLEEVVAN